MLIRSFFSFALFFAGFSADAQQFRQVINVAEVWSGHPVGFDLLTRSDRQFVAFYNAERQMTVGMRPLTETNWTFAQLPEKIGWDSHNYITFAMDRDGFLHLSGNMHSGALIYFRTKQPLDITTFQREPMVGIEETKTTYPKFFTTPAGEFAFTYRSGSSGNGIQIYNVYDLKTREWKRLLQEPLLDGEGKKNAYLNGPISGPDGYYHLVWIWRETPDCATSHYICYAKSRDLISWETSQGEKLKLPITFQTGEVVDPVPMHGGAINGNVALAFDSQKRPIVSYHKFDTNGFTQIYNARLETGAWKIYQATDWNYRWEFGGGGSIEFEIRVGAVSKRPDGKLAQAVTHKHLGSGTWLLDEKTLRFSEKLETKPRSTDSLKKVESDFPGMRVMQKTSAGDSKFAMRWETLPPNRDRPREGDLPPPSWLRVYEMGDTPQKTNAPIATAQAAPEWDEFFQRTNGWLGADGNYSIALSTNRTLWLFSDTWVGEVRDGKRANVRMINNSIGIQRHGETPDYFYRTNKDGFAESFIKPEHGLGFFWLFGGTKTDAGIYLFLRRIEIHNPNTVFGFRGIGTTLGYISNSDDPPMQWKIDQLDFPFTEYSTNGNITYGAATMRDGDFIYIYGIDERKREGEPKNRQVAARVLASEFGDMKSWRFFADGEWQSDFKKATPLCPDIPGEHSVSFVPALNEYALIYTEGAMWGKIVMRRGPSPVGPWSEPIHLFRAPEMDWTKKTFCYAAKAHPQISGKNELMITYAANSFDVGEVINDARFYWPRFVRVKF